MSRNFIYMSAHCHFSRNALAGAALRCTQQAGFTISYNAVRGNSHKGLVTHNAGFSACGKGYAE